MSGNVPSKVREYSIEREIGRGGMGVVYLARDERLGRKVAIKAITSEIASDAERKARFEREARALAVVNHANVAGIYEIEEVEGRPYLVLEFVEGETLTEKIRSGHLSANEALVLCAQIASGMEAAHEAGVIHRDLKPSNIKITADGTVKILDFGLAKGMAATRASSVDVTSTPTVSVPPPSAMTQVGMVMGTAGYMSPEQARGKPIDKRTDIWSFGCVLYECLTGRMVFGGETVSDCIAAVLEREPDWNKLPDKTPLRVRELLRRCLEKNSKDRLRDIGDARHELERAVAGKEWTTGTMAAARPRGMSSLVRPASVGLGLVVALSLIVVLVPPLRHAVFGWLKGSNVAIGSDSPGSQGATLPVTRLSIVLPTEPRVSERIQLSPDGRTLAYLARATGERSRIYLRRLDSFESAPVAGTEGAYYVCFSPDGQWLAFSVRENDTTKRTSLRKVQLSGGPPLTLHEEAEDAILLPTWITASTIAFVAGSLGRELKLISSDGGEARTLWDAKLESGQERFHWLSLAPGGAHLLVTVPILDAKGWRQTIVSVSLEKGESKTLQERSGFAKPGPENLVLYSQGDALLARPFDPVRGEFSGGPLPIMSGLRAPLGYCGYLWWISDRGDLAYATGGRSVGKRHLALADMSGKVEVFSKTPGDFEFSALISPDGSRILGNIVTDTGTYDLCVYDIAKDSLRRLSGGGLDCSAACWHPDGKRVIYSIGNSTTPCRMMMRNVDEAASPTVILTEKTLGTWIGPRAVTHDGKWVLCARADPAANTARLRLVGLEGDHEEREVFAEAGTQWKCDFSPDDRWIVYESDPDGITEVFVRPNPLQAGTGSVKSESGGSERITVSAHGGRAPMWSPDGKTIVFREGRSRLVAVDVTTEPKFRCSTPRELFDWESLDAETDITNLSPDGKHIAFAQKAEGERTVTQINLVQNWGREVREKARAGGK